MGIVSRKIRSNLHLLETRYNSVMQSNRLDASIEAVLYSKLAVIELCGWIEESIDCILIDYVMRTVRNTTIIETIRKEIIDTVYGFKYKDNFRPLMEKIIGAARFQKIMLQLRRRGLQDEVLKNQLHQLSTARNQAAHTYWHQQGTQRFDAPSITIGIFEVLLPILKKIEGMVRRTNQ